MPLKEYGKKRNFNVTSEPAGKSAPKQKNAPLIYVIQKHRATVLHYDFRLEWKGVLLSWAVPKGPSLDPAVKRLAMHVEDHPVDYASFEGTIPEGEYGGGTVMVWDQGTWTPEQEDVDAALAKGDLKITLHGKKLKGSWVLVRTHGYGLHSFRQSLITCFEQLTDVPITPEKHQRIASFAQSIADQEIELLPGVATTLADLATRHRLILVTKGNQEEQTDKLHRSGLAQHFTAVEILPEKHPEAYLALTTHHGCEACNTWMIGNSPRSDINPALGAGLNAIFIPHDFTWVLEHEVVNQPPSGQHLLELATFADLTLHF